MSKGLFNWSSYTEKKESKFASPEKGDDTIPKPKYKEQRVRVIRIYLKHRDGHIVGMLNKNTSLLDEAPDAFSYPNGGLKVNDAIYINPNQFEALERENMSEFYIPISSMDFLEEGKGWLVEEAKKEGDN